MLYNEEFMSFFEESKKEKNIFEIEKICKDIVLDKSGAMDFTGIIVAMGGAGLCLVSGFIKTAATIAFLSTPLAIIGGALIAIGAIIFLYNMINNKNLNEVSDKDYGQGVEENNEVSPTPGNETLPEDVETGMAEDLAKNGEQDGNTPSSGDGDTPITKFDTSTKNPYEQGSGSNGVQQPTIDYVAEAVEAAKANQDKALGNYQDILQQIMPNQMAMQDMLQQNLESIQNPFDVTEETGDEEENDEQTIKNIKEMKEKLTFDKDSFEAIEAYDITVGDIKSYLYVTSEIKVITDLDNYKEFGLNSFTGTKYTENGQTHYVARAYDADGNPLDSVIESVQSAYLAFGGKSASNGYAKLSGTGNETNYCVEGYGAITFGGVEKFSFYIQGNYDSKDNPTIEISEATRQNVSDTYKGTLRTAMETMRAVNNNSYKVEKGEGVTFEFDLSSSTKKETHEEDGHTYTYNKEDKVSITTENTDISKISGVDNGLLNPSTTQSTMTVEEALNRGYTMEDLIEEGYEPLEKDGEEYSEEKEIEKDADNADFEIELTKEVSFLDSKCMFYVDNMTIYSTYGNYRDCVSIKDSNGNSYSVDDAISNEICTIEVLLKKLEKDLGATTFKMN